MAASAVLVWLIVVASAVWVWSDAPKHDLPRATCVVTVLLVWLIAFPLYLYQRRRRSQWAPGAPMGAKSWEDKVPMFIGAAVVVVAISLVASALNGTGGSAPTLDASSSEPCTESSAMSFVVLDKDPRSLTGTCIHFDAQVRQFDTATGPSDLLADMTPLGYGVWENLVDISLTNASQGADIYETDVVAITGRVDGTQSYQMVNGGTNTVPLVVATHIAKLSGP